MQERPVSLDVMPDPSVTVLVYRDTNGHYFASVEQAVRNGNSFTCTATWTTAEEAVKQAATLLTARAAGG